MLGSEIQAVVPAWLQMLGVPLDEPQKLVKLWGHEVLRVFHDRLVRKRIWVLHFLTSISDAFKA